MQLPEESIQRSEESVLGVNLLLPAEFGRPPFRERGMGSRDDARASRFARFSFAL